MKHILSTAVVLTCLLAGWNTGAMAASKPMPPGNPMLPQLAEMDGALKAGVELCDMKYDIASSKRRQHEKFIQMGGTPEQFETAYQAGYERAKSKFEAANASDRQRMCNEFSALVSAQPGVPSR